MMIIAALAIYSFAPLAHAGIYENFRAKHADRVAQLEKGEQVLLTEEGPQGPWPKVTMYQIMDATPEEVMAVFFDYNHHAEVFKTMYRSVVTKWRNPRQAEVEYAIAIPLHADEVYTVLDTLSTYDAGRSYQIAWNLLRARTTVSSEGWIKAEVHGSKTLIEYYNFVVPGSRMARMRAIRNRAISQLSQTVETLKNEVPRRKKEEPARFSENLNSVRQALKN